MVLPRTFLCFFFVSLFQAHQFLVHQLVLALRFIAHRKNHSRSPGAVLCPQPALWDQLDTTNMP